MKKYEFDGEVYGEKEILEAAENILEAEGESFFKEEFDELNEMVEIAGCTYLASRVWEEVDPIAYKCEFDNWVSNKLEDFEYELSCLSEGNSTELLDYTIYCEED